MDSVARILEVGLEGVWDSVKVPVMDGPLHCVHTDKISLRLDASDCIVARGTYMHPCEFCGLKTVLSHQQLLISFLRSQPYEGQEWLSEEHTCNVGSSFLSFQSTLEEVSLRPVVDHLHGVNIPGGPVC